MSARHRLLWLILLLAVLGAGWMLVGRAGVLEDLGLATRRSAEDAEALDDDEAVAIWDEAAEEAPRLIGRRGATANDGYLRADGRADGARGQTAGPAKSAPGAGATVRFGGVVLGPDGQPVADVRVLLRADGGAVREETTQANGRFAVELAAGRYDVSLKAEGLGGLNLPDYLVDGATGVDVEFALRRAHRLELGIRRAGLPVVDARVSVNPLEGIGGESLQTDEAGAAVFEGLVAGRYRVEVALLSGETIARGLDLRRDEAIQVDVPPGVLVRGRVEDADAGGPVEGAEVAAWVRGPAGTWISASAETDATGAYELEVPQGRIGRFEVSASGYAAWPDRKLIRSVLRSLRDLASGKEVQRDVVLTQGLSVAGRVENTDGEGVEGLELSFKPRRGAALTTRTGDDGAYELPGVRSETYDVVVLTEGWFSERALVVRIPRLEPGSVHAVDLTVQATISVQGRVLHHDGSPASGARVWITGGGRLLRAAHDAGRDLETFTDAQGGWRLHDLPAEQGVSVRAALGSLEAKPRGLRTSALPDKPIELKLAPTVTVKGTVIDVTTRRPLAGVGVLVRPKGAPGGRTARRVTTDAEGTFEVFGLIPGPWELTPSKAGFLTATAHAEDLTGVEGEREVALHLDPGLVLAGTVTDVGGQRLANVRITVTGVSRSGAKVTRSATTRSGGVFHLTGFEAGDYRLVARRNGYRNVSLPGLQGGEDRIDVQMRPRAK